MNLMIIVRRLVPCALFSAKAPRRARLLCALPILRNFSAPSVALAQQCEKPPQASAPRCAQLRTLLPTMSAREEYRVKELNTSGGANRFKVRRS